MALSLRNDGSGVLVAAGANLASRLTRDAARLDRRQLLPETIPGIYGAASTTSNWYGTKMPGVGTNSPTARPFHSGCANLSIMFNKYP